MTMFTERDRDIETYRRITATLDVMALSERESRALLARSAPACR